MLQQYFRADTTSNAVSVVGTSEVGKARTRNRYEPFGLGILTAEICEFGELAGTRTQDPLIKSQML